ncbi:MAG: ribosomal-protein-alanine N-acetyltransferase, partial [Patescibacteria group bacterium]
KDMPEMIRIESENFERPYSEEDFCSYRKQPNCTGMVGERDGYIVGFMFYELNKTSIDLFDIAIDTEYHREEVGTQLIDRLIDKLVIQRRTEINVEVPETNIDAQWFFYENGFRATKVLKGYFDDTDEDAYAMRYKLKRDSSELEKLYLKNRISEFLDV